MSIPLDRLYHYLESLCSEDILIYRWLPHGSKKIEDLSCLNSKHSTKSFAQKIMLPQLICHDQEPLNYHLYTNDDCYNSLLRHIDRYNDLIFWRKSESFLKSLSNSHLRTATESPISYHDYILLCHSEKNSDQLKLYESNGFVGVYYWSHAIIARDWYRFAQHDNDLNLSLDKIQKDFLVYNRAWSGTREYRLKFVELLLDNNLLSNCNIKFNPYDNGYHYSDHHFCNIDLKIKRFDLENYIEQNTSDSSSSANYVNNDYNQTGLEVVLETLFDDRRQHLTEKTLRPIACGKAFILVGPAHSLSYLKNYGFKTFEGLIDESYDHVQDSSHRLHYIMKELKRISLMSSNEKKDLWTKLQEIADYNKRWFFSKEFHDLVVDEFVNNVKHGLLRCQQNLNGHWWHLALKTDLENKTLEKTQKEINNILLTK